MYSALIYSALIYSALICLHTLSAGREVYRFLGAADNLRIEWRQGQHHGFESLDRWVGCSSSNAHTPILRRRGYAPPTAGGGMHLQAQLTNPADELKRKGGGVCKLRVITALSTTSVCNPTAAPDEKFVRTAWIVSWCWHS